MKYLNQETIKSLSENETNVLRLESKFQDENLVLFIEVMNMYDATGDREFKDFPYVVSLGVMPENIDFEIVNESTCEETFKSQDEFNKCEDKETYYNDANNYAGTCQMKYYLTEELDMGDIYGSMSISECCLTKHAVDFGGLAYEFGKGFEVDNIKFANEEAAYKYLALVLEAGQEYLNDSEFIEECMYRPSNLIGDTWERTFNTLLNKAV